MKVKIILLLIFSSFISSGWAQSVTYRNYGNYEKDILNILKETGGVSSFASMPLLKQQSLQVKENTPVNVVLPKPSKKQMDGEQLVDQRSRSVLLVCKYSPKLVQPEHVQVGASAFILSEDGVCATNYHVLQPLLDGRQVLSPLDSILFVADVNKKCYPITKILSYNREADFAIFKIDTKGAKLPAIPMGNDLAAGAPIQTLTHPEWHMFYYSEGVVARTLCTNEQDPFTNRAEVTADYAKGSSGAPFFDKCGNMVGMVSATQSIYYVDYPQTSLQMVVKSIIPVSSFKRLVSGK
jgi:S1-C subfamily serine protease